MEEGDELWLVEEQSLPWEGRAELAFLDRGRAQLERVYWIVS